VGVDVLEPSIVGVEVGNGVSVASIKPSFWQAPRMGLTMRPPASRLDKRKKSLRLKRALLSAIVAPAYSVSLFIIA
jgi:hypothetical protein